MSKASIRVRASTLADAVRGDAVHKNFSPRQSWWLLTNSTNAKDLFPNAVTFLEQTDVSEEDMAAAFGRQWRGGVGTTHLPEVTVRDFGTRVLWASIKPLPTDKASQESGTPNHSDIVLQRPDEEERVDMEKMVASLPRTIKNCHDLFTFFSKDADEDFEKYLADCK